jgi:hypothetical protein
VERYREHAIARSLRCCGRREPGRRARQESANRCRERRCRNARGGSCDELARATRARVVWQDTRGEIDARESRPAGSGVAEPERDGSRERAHQGGRSHHFERDCVDWINYGEEVREVNDHGEALALRVGTLVSVRHRTGAPSAALVVASDSAVLTLHVSGRLPPAQTERVVLAFGVAGEMREREAEVLAVQSTSQEMRVAAFGSPLPESERRAVERFDAVGAAELSIGGDTYHGRLTDVSVLGAGLDVAAPGPDTIQEGALVVHDAFGALLPATRVRVAYRHLPTGKRVRIGVEFSDPRGVAEATRRLIDLLNSRA